MASNLTHNPRQACLLSVRPTPPRMASSYISSPVDNESSRNSSPLGTPAALLGGLTLLPHTPVPDTEPDGLLLGAYHPSDNPRDPASEPSVCAHSGQGDQTNLERDDASSPAPSREASATERVGYQSIPTSGEFDGLLPPAGTPVPSVAPPPSSQPSNPQPSSAAPAPLPSPTQPPKSDDTPSTPVIGKPSATQEHSFKDPSNKHVRHTIRIGYAMELQGRLSHIPLDRFMAEFVPGGDIPPDTVLDTFDQSAFKREGPAMYNNLVSKSINATYELLTDFAVVAVQGGQFCLEERRRGGTCRASSIRGEEHASDARPY